MEYLAIGAKLCVNCILLLEMITSKAQNTGQKVFKSEEYLSIITLKYRNGLALSEIMKKLIDHLFLGQMYSSKIQEVEFTF